MRDYEYRKLRLRALPPYYMRTRGNSPESPTILPPAEERTGEEPTISVTEYTVSADGTTRILKES